MYTASGAMVSGEAARVTKRAGVLPGGLPVRARRGREPGGCRGMDEDRLRVARNARVEEETSGLLSGTSVVKHAITVELKSMLGSPARVEVVERVPVSDDTGVRVETALARPEPKPWKPDDQVPPLRGGLLFPVEVPAGGKAKVELSYVLSFSAKSEVVGGNRRE